MLSRFSVTRTTSILALGFAFNVACPNSVFAVVLWTNPITGTDPGNSNPYTTGQMVDSRITVSGIGRGSGLSANSGDNRYNANSWGGTSRDATDYFTFTLTPKAGYEIDLMSFVYSGQRSNSGPNTFEFRSSKDSFASSIGSPTATGTTISLAASAYQNLTSAIEFRLYGWGNSAAGGTFSVNDFTFNGEVAPEPTTTLLFGGSAVGLLAARRRREGRNESLFTNLVGRFVKFA